MAFVRAQSNLMSETRLCIAMAEGDGGRDDKKHQSTHPPVPRWAFATMASWTFADLAGTINMNNVPTRLRREAVISEGLAVGRSHVRIAM